MDGMVWVDFCHDFATPFARLSSSKLLDFC